MFTNQTNLFSMPDLGQFNDPHLLPLFNNYGPNARAPTPQSQNQTQSGPKKNTLEPYVTGTSVLAVRYKDGVMIAADTLASYGSLARFRDVRRMHSLGKYTLIGATGEYSDYQYLLKLLDDLIVDDQLAEDGSSLSPHSIHSYLTRVLYGRRNKIDPLWGQFVVAGYKGGKSFLGLADLRGTSYQDNTIATGYGGHIARCLMREKWREDLTEKEAKDLLEECLRVLYYRDARSLNRIQIATITANGPFISEPYELSSDWDVGTIIYGDGVKNSNFDLNSKNIVIQ